MKKVSDLVAEFLKEKNIEIVFAIIGSANAHIFDSINNLGYTKIINVHHEQAAVMAMGAYYRASGKYSATIVTAGAGSTNAVTGVVSNWADSIPGIIISGQEPTRYLKQHSKLRMYGTQGLDMPSMLNKVIKYAKTVFDPNDIQDELEVAFKESYSGRPGPCWIDIPLDVQSSVVNERNWSRDLIQKTSMPDNESLYKLKEMLNSSKRPVILAGNGIRLSGSQKQFKDFVEKNNIPTLLSWSGIDLLPDSHDNFFGRPGIYGQRSANFIIQNSDTVFVLGSRTALPQVGYDFSQFARDAKIIIVDVDELEGTKYNPDLYLNANCKDIIELLLDEEFNLDISEWIEYCKITRQKYPYIEAGHVDGGDGYLNSYKFMEMLSGHLSDNHIIVTDMGTALLSGHQSIRLKENQTMFTSQGLGEMGYGLPGAIGAQLAEPNRPVLCLNCDGGIMMNLQELHTIIENDLPIKIIIFNNDGYLMIKQTQKLFHNSRYVSVDKNSGLGLPNFDKLMPAFGYNYYNLSSWDKFHETIQLFLQDPSASALEVFMDPLQDFIPKVKGIVNDDNTIIAPPIEEMSPLLSLQDIKDSMIIALSSKSGDIKR